MSSQHKQFVFFVGAKKFETEKSHQTAREILAIAGASVDTNTLALKKQGGFDEFHNLDEPIEMKEGMHFVLFDKTPTTVS